MKFTKIYGTFAGILVGLIMGLLAGIYPYSVYSVPLSQIQIWQHIIMWIFIGLFTGVIVSLLIKFALKIKFSLQGEYKTLNKIEIIKNNLLHNLELLQSRQKHAEIFPVLKSNAYGHGIKEICEILEKTNVKMVCVDSFPEAQIVLENSTKRVLIIGEMSLKSYKLCDFNRTEFCVYNIETLKYLANINKQINIHLFLNTGMNREGIQNLKEFLEESKKYLDKINIVGLCSHLASAEEDSKLNKEQEEKFFQNLDLLKENKIYPKWVHLGNSAGTFILSDKRLTAFRPGIAFYGYNIFPKNHEKFNEAEKLKPALRILSEVVAVQKLKAGEKVSYNETFTADKETNIAVIPFGYYEGLDRRLSSAGEFKINNFYARIAGRVCMNLTCINCKNNKIKVGEEVEVVSENPSLDNSVKQLSNLMGTIPYEFLVKLQGNIRREIE